MTGIPTPKQLAWQRSHQFALFCHVGINTFFAREWSDGSLPASGFDPSSLDCRQWVDIAKRAGAAHIILTAKHHDGFCLWPTSTTDYSVAGSPWRNGAGDVVRELADACAVAGIGLGLYLSPWDRHDPDWSANPAAYDARYITQLTELCTGYGPLVELWFDGAGSEQHPYDWPAIMDVIRTHQPDAMVFNMGEPTIRWIGNEDGLASDPVWYTIDSVEQSIYTDVKKALPGGDTYCPPECDVAIRRHWFWQPDDVHTLKSVNHLLAIWYRSVGLGANLLLNVPPDRRGLIDPADEARLMEFADALTDRFREPINATLHQKQGRLMARFDEPVTFDHLILREQIEQGQHVRNHHVVDARSGAPLAKGFTVGSQRVHAFTTTTTDAVIVELEGGEAQLESVTAYLTGIELTPELEEQPAFDTAKMSEE